jgi:Rho termination factor, N-terminal domain
MHTIDNLNVMLISELKEIAEGLGVKNAKKLNKEELVYKILDQQAVTGEKPVTKKSEQDPERKMRPRKRENVAPATESKPEKEVSSEEMLKSLDFEIDQNITNFDEPKNIQRTQKAYKIQIHPLLRQRLQQTVSKTREENLASHVRTDPTIKTNNPGAKTW